MNDYVKELRKVVGSRPIMLCGAGATIINSRNEILLQRRRDNGCWGCPGGAVELGETVEETAIREVYEETGLRVKNLELFGIYSGKDTYFQYPNGDEVYCINIVFIAKNFHGDIRVDDAESKELKFFDIDNLPDDITPLCVPIMRDLKKYMITGG